MKKKEMGEEICEEGQGEEIRLRYRERVRECKWGKWGGKG
jgi:hypothetical protein